MVHVSRVYWLLSTWFIRNAFFKLEDGPNLRSQPNNLAVRGF